MSARQLAVVTVVACLPMPVAIHADMVPPGSQLAVASFELPAVPSKWEPGANTASIFSAAAIPGTPGGATWSIMGAGFSDASGADMTHGANTTVVITSLGFSLSTIQGMIDAALNVWAAASGFTNLGQVTDGGVNAGASEAGGGQLGDIRITAWAFDSLLDQLFTLAHAATPGTEATDGAGGTLGGDLHLNPDQLWVDDPTDVGFDPFFDTDVDLPTVLLHELGHSLGLDHSPVAGSVMEASYMGARRTLHADDIAGIQAIYGASQAVPEPPALLLLGFALLVMALVRVARRRPAVSHSVWAAALTDGNRIA